MDQVRHVVTVMDHTVRQLRHDHCLVQAAVGHLAAALGTLHHRCHGSGNHAEEHNLNQAGWFSDGQRVRRVGEIPVRKQRAHYDGGQRRD